MANSITSDLTISTAVSKLGDLLAPIGNFTLNVSTDSAERGATIKVPVVDTDDVARDYAGSYVTNSNSSVSTANVAVTEAIKPFKLSDQSFNQSPLTLANYIEQNAHEFGRYLLNKIFTQLDADLGNISNKNSSSINADAVSLANIKGMAGDLDAAGAPSNRHLVLAADSSNALMPSTIETFGRDILESGRFQSLYGLNVHPSTAFNTGAATEKKVHTFAASSNALVIVNRLPVVQAESSLLEYTTFNVDPINLQVAYRRWYDANTGIHYGAFTTMYGVAVAVPEHLSVITKTY